MKNIFSLLLPVILTSASCTATYDNAPDEQISKQPHEVFGGTDIDPAEVPYMVSFIDPNSKHLCAGVVITSRWVLTTATCIMDVDTFAEVPIANVGGVPYSVLMSSSVLHPSFNANTLLNNIALVRMTKDIDMSNTRIAPVVLPYGYLETAFDNMSLSLTGWGTTSYSGPRNASLQRATVNTVSNSIAALEHPEFEWHPGMIATGIPGGDSAGNCQYDTGNPIVAQSDVPILVGLYSQPMSQGCNGSDIYTRVPHYLQWIQSVVGAPTPAYGPYPQRPQDPADAILAVTAEQNFQANGSPFWNYPDVAAQSAFDTSTDWGRFIMGGSYASGYNCGPPDFYNCLQLRGNAGVESSAWYPMSLGKFGKAFIDFQFYGYSMEDGERLHVEWWDGSDWVVLGSAIFGEGYNQNDILYQAQVTISNTVSGYFPASGGVRFRLEASGANDFVYVDKFFLRLLPKVALNF